MKTKLSLRDSKGSLGNVGGPSTDELAYHLNSSGKKGQTVVRVAGQAETNLKIGPALEKKAEMVLQKEAGFTRAGKRRNKALALARNDLSTSARENMRDNPATGFMIGELPRGPIGALRARKSAFRADHPIQALVPFRGMGSDGQKKLDKLKKKRKKNNKKKES